MLGTGENGLLSDDKVYHTCFINGLLNQTIRMICQIRAKDFDKAYKVARQEKEEASKTVSAIVKNLSAENERETASRQKREPRTIKQI
jgi:hypothetical protein